MGQIIEISDDRKKTWQFKYNHRRLEELQFPSEKVEQYKEDEQGNRICVISPDGQKTYFNHDARNNITERILPGKQRTTFSFDRNHQPLKINHPDGTSLTWTRDFFGHIESHKDLGDRNINYEYDNLKNVKRQTSKGGKARSYATVDEKVGYYPGDKDHNFPLIIQEQKIQIVPDQDIQYDYAFGDLLAVKDGEKTVVYKERDSEGRSTNLQIQNPKGEVLKNIETKFDALGRDILTTDTHKSVTSFISNCTQETLYDPVGNRRHHKVLINPPSASALCSLPPQQQDYWFTYNAADKALITNGVLDASNHVTIAPNQGVEFSYQGSFRNKEKIKNEKGVVVEATLEYEDDGNLKTTQTNDEFSLKTTRRYNLNGPMDHYEENYYDPKKSIPHEIKRDLKFNENNWLTEEDFVDLEIHHDPKHNSNLKIKTLFQNFDAMGNPHYQDVAKMFDGRGIRDRLHTDYFPLETK